MNPTPRFRDVALEEIRIVALSLRIVALVVLLVLASGTVVIVHEILRGGPGFDSRETLPTALFSFLIPFAVWRHEKRFGPTFFWTLPVDRRRLALAKVFAGLVWTIAALAFFTAWLGTMALIARAPVLFMVSRVPLTATIAAYLLGSALVLGLHHPLRWLLGIAGVFMLVNRSFSYTAFTVDNMPPLFPFVCLGAGLLALWVAASRHKETR